jgi:hypothetical protein
MPVVLVAQHVDLQGRRQAGGQLGQPRLDGVDGGDHVGARLALHVQDDGGLELAADHRPCAQAHVLGAVHRPGHVGQPHGRAVAVGDDHVAVIGGRHQLVVGIDGVGPGRPVDAALGAVGVGRRQRRAQAVEREAVGSQRPGVRLDPHRRPLAARQRHQADAGDLADLERQPGVDDVLHLRQRQRVGGDGQRQHRRVGRIDLGVDRRRRQVGRQQRAAGIDGGLHLLLGDVQRQPEAELQRHDRDAGRAGGSHARQPRHLAELSLQWGGDGLRHHLRAGARVQRLHLDRGVVDLRQRRQWQEPETDQAGQHDGHHQ